jgi:ribosomal protein S20
MPVTKTAKRAQRVSKRKSDINKKRISEFEIASRKAKKTLRAEDINKAISIADRLAKNNVIHKNKAARIKAQLSRLSSSPKKKSDK